MQISLDQAIPHQPFFNERFKALGLAIAFHALVLGLGSLGLMHNVEYGIDTSLGMQAVDLIAAPAPTAPVVSQSAPPPAPITPEDVVEPEKTPLAPAAAIASQNPSTGRDSQTLYHAGSSGVYFQPGYYRNPPPRYPAEARKHKQEGRVLLEVNVTSEGKVGSSRIKQSSGFPLLDEAALQGVRNWKFRPATVGGLRVDILADVPIRFQLQ